MSLASVLVACHGDASALPDEGAPGTVIQIDTHSDRSSFDFLALRDGDGPWTALEPAQRGFLVHADRYTVVGVCGSGTFEVQMVGATVSDGTVVELPCVGFALPAMTYRIDGTAVQPGAAAIGDAQSSTTPNWQFAFDVRPGPHTLVVVGNGKSLRHSLDVSQPVTLPNIDVDATGTDLASVSYTLTGVAADAGVTSRIDAYITDPAHQATDFEVLPASAGTTVQPLPASYFQPEDQQEVELVATFDGGEQVADVIATPAGMTIDMLPPLAGVVLSDGQASWTQPLPSGRVDLLAHAGTGPTESFAHFKATQAWLADATSLAFDTADIPGFQAEWLTGTSVENLWFSVASDEVGLLRATIVGHPPETEPLGPVSKTDSRANRPIAP